MKLKVVSSKVSDIRVPTSDTLLGSDPFHKKPNYSCVYTSIQLSDGTVGHSVCFTSGAGNDWIVYGVNDISKLLEDYSFEDFTTNPGNLYKEINDHHQLRWLADGVNRMALGCIMNAMWDCWAKIEKKPLWKLLVDLDPDKNLRKLFLEDQDSDDDASLYVPSHKKGELGATITVLNADEWDELSYPDVKVVICDCSPVLSENPVNLVKKFDYCVIPTTLNPLGVAKNGDVNIAYRVVGDQNAEPVVMIMGLSASHKIWHSELIKGIVTRKKHHSV